MQQLRTGQPEAADTAGIDDKLKPVFEFIKTLTHTPAGNSQERFDAIIAAGWDDNAVQLAASISGCINFSIAVSRGWGVRGDMEYFAKAGELFVARGYLGLIMMLEGQATI